MDRIRKPTGRRTPAPWMLLLAAGLLATVPVLAVEDDLEAALRQHVSHLASDALEGRLTGTAGAAEAADYLVEQLHRLGAVPLPEQEDLRIPFTFTAGVRDAGSRVTLEGENVWRGGEQVRALPFADEGQVSGSVVFAGYGMVVPEGQGYPYDSYVGLDVAGKIVVLLRYFPEDVEQEDRAVLARYSGLRFKAMQARERGASGVIVVTGPRSPGAGETVPMTFDTAVAGSGIVAVSVGGEVAEALFDAAGQDLEEVQAELDTGNPHVSGFEIPVRASIEARVEREERTGTNVVAVLPPPGSMPAATEKPWVVLGAHYDHLGRGLQGSSLAGADDAGEIHNGADDNASGVAAVLEAGRILADTERDRSIVLAFWSGEEMGLLGSTAFLREEVLTPSAIAAYLNFDMVGRSRDNGVVVQAVGSAEAWPGLIERSNVPVGLDIQIQEDPYLPTDSAAFNQQEVPNLSFFTGSHSEYHRPDDDAHLLVYEGLARITRLGALIATRLARADEPAPAFVSVPRTSPAAGDRDTVRAFTGTIPDYTGDVEGLRLGGVIEGGPAEEAGLQEGDVIVEFAGRSITNIYDYTYALDVVKVGEEVKVVYVRDGERRETTLVPTARR